MARRRRAIFLACLAAGPLLLTGCSGAGHSRERDESGAGVGVFQETPSPKTLPPAGPADFPVPSDARLQTENGVRSFVRYYLALANHTLVSLDATPLRDLSRSCQTCTELADGYDRAKAAGHKYQGGALSVTSEGSAVVKGETGELSFVLRQGPLTVRDSSGAVIVSLSSAERSFTAGMRLNWSSQERSWFVSQFDAEPL